MLWQAWQLDYGPPSQVARAPESVVSDDSPTYVPSDTQKQISSVSIDVLKPNSIPSKRERDKVVKVATDVFNIEINTLGAGIQRVELPQYLISVDQPDEPFVLMGKEPSLTYFTQNGLLNSKAAPSHMASYTSDAATFSLSPEQELLEVPFHYESETGLRVTKTFVFERGSYLIKSHYTITNNSTEDWIGRSYSQIKRNNPGRAVKMGTYTYTGGVFSTPETRYEKIGFDDIQEQSLKMDVSDGWIAMIQHYFVSALVPDDKTKNYHYYTNALSDGNFAIGAMTPNITISKGNTGVIKEQIYIGPKIQDDLEEIADGLQLTVDYGVLWLIAKPLFSCMSFLYGLTLNWGWAIILVTILLKLIFYPLSAKGYKSMAGMRKIQPRMLEMKKRYQNDKTKQQQAMMQIYKEEKVNPFGGCLPILVQIPVFIALYWVLLESVEIRQANFIFWLNDLSSPDPFYVLPVLFGISSFIQTKLNPLPPDPVQAKIMSFIPIVFTVMFAFFPSGLVLYWVVNNVLSIAQQWFITRSMEKAGLA